MKETVSNLRFGMGLTALFLLITELIIGIKATGWIRSYLGDILVVMLIYSTVRTITPVKPDYCRMCGFLPTLVLLFAIIVEGLQYFNIADLLGIRNEILRTVIGTSFSAFDIFCYIIGIIPCYIAEIYLKRNVPSKE